MGQCWQDPTQRIQIEQVYHELDHLTSARRDTLEVSIDFDQRWSELPPNKRAPSSGSRIALAGSFAGSTNTERSSTASTIPESVPDFTLSSESSAEHIAEGPPVPFVTTANGGGDTEMVGTREEELRTSQSEHLGSGDTEMTDSGEKSLESVDESGNQIVNLTPVKPVVVASSTPSGPTQSDSSEFFSPLTSTPASLYATASEETQSASKETSLANNDTTIQSINDDTETEEKNENQQLTGDFSDFVRTSPTIGHPDFGDFESSLTPTTVDSSNEKVHTPTGSADFTDFEGAGDNFSTAKLGNISDAQTQEKLVEESISKELEAPQSLSLEFESLNMDSFAEGKPGDTSSPFADQANSQDTDLVTSVTAPSLESDPAEKIETFNSGPLLDEDIDQLVQLPDVSLGNISVPSLPSEPALLLPVETSAVQPPQAMAFTDVPEPQQSLVQDLESLPVPQVPEKSADSLMAALGESLESHPISLLESPQELQEPEGNLLGDIPGFEKVGTDRKYESLTDVHSLCDVEEEQRLKSGFSPHSCDTSVHPVTENAQLEESHWIGLGPQAMGARQNCSGQSPLELYSQRVDMEQHEFGIVNSLEVAGSPTDVIRQNVEKSEIFTPSHFQLTHVPTEKSVPSLDRECNQLKEDHVICPTVTDDSGPLLLSQQLKAAEQELLSPDDDTTGDSGIHSGRQEHFSDSVDDDDDDDDNEEVEEGLARAGYARTESPFNTLSPADSDSDVSTTSSTSTSGSSGGEYSCDTGQHTPRPSLDTGQRFGVPLDTGQSHRHNMSNSLSGQQSTEEETLKMVTDLYLSKGVKSPRTFEVRPLETIPEDQVLSPPSLYRENSIATPSDTSSLEVRYEDLFGSDGFEWDDLCGDPGTGLRTSPERVSSPTLQEDSDETTDMDSHISSTRQALNQILSRTGLLNKTSSLASHRYSNSDPVSATATIIHPSPSASSAFSVQLGLPSSSHLNRLHRSGGEISASIYSLAEDYSFDSDSLSEACDIGSIHSFDQEEAEHPTHDTCRSPGSQSPPITPSSPLSPELASSSHKIAISDNACGTDPLLPSQLGRGTKQSCAHEVTQ